MNRLLIFTLILSIVLISFCTQIPRSYNVKYELPDDKVLVFVGQDNESVGGNNRFNNGYVDHIGVPAGITHYIALGSGAEDGKIPGLEVESTWGAGPMCLKYYVDSPNLKNCIMHLSITMADHEKEVAEGVHDSLILQIANFLKQYQEFPFFLRIGYEFDGEWNHYDSTNYKIAFRRIVDKLKAENIKNFATVFTGSSHLVDYKLWKSYYPGDEYVDWCGYSYWGGDTTSAEAHTAIKFARAHSKPIFIAEIAPRGYYFLKEDGKAFWDKWFVELFEHIENYKDVVKAISYINCNWYAQPMWDGWGDTRIQVVPYIKQKWLEKMTEPAYIIGTDEVFSLIGFRQNNPPR